MFSAARPTSTLRQLHLSASLLVLPSLFALTACGGESPSSMSVSSDAQRVVSVDETTPETAAKQMFAALENEGIGSFLLMAVPPEELSEMRDSWAEQCKQPISDDEEAQYQQFLGMLMADGAEDTLFGMVQPQLQEAQQQLEGLAMMLPMMAAGMVEETGAPDDAVAMLGSFGEKVAKLDIASEDKARAAIRALIATVRAVDIESGAALQKLDFDALMGKVDVLSGGVFDIFEVYGLSVEDTMKSIQVSTVSVDGDVAKMEMSISVFGMEPQTLPFDMERVAGKWHLKKEETDQVQQPAADGMAR